MDEFKIAQVAFEAGRKEAIDQVLNLMRSSSVWDDDYLYLRKSRLIDEVMKLINKKP